MNVLILANHCDTGGITSYVMTLVRGLTSHGHDVTVATGGGEMVPDLEAAGARHVRAGLRVKCEIHPSIFLSLPGLSRLVRRHRVDIIHAQTRSTQMCAASLSRLTGVPFLSTCHGFFSPRLGRRLWPMWGQGVIAISAEVREHLLRDFGVPSEDVCLVRNGIETRFFHPVDPVSRDKARSEWGCRSGSVIGIVARLSDVKGHTVLIEAMSAIVTKVPDVTCLIVGRGPMEDELKMLVHRKGLEACVRFHRVVNRTADILPLLDIFVLPSIQEGISLSAMEAGACGVPVVGSRVGGIPEVVMDGETGLLVPPADPPALATAIVELLRDPVRSRSMGQRARDVVREQFSAERMVGETVRVYDKILSASPHAV